MDTAQGRVCRSFSTLLTAFKLYADFHTAVSLKLLEAGGDTLLIDCHSFSAQPNLLNAEPSEIDICIGYNDDDSCPPRTTIDTIAHHFASSGYKIGINVPFSNAKTFAVPAPYHSVMIEVNKRLYMNEQTLQKSAEFERLQQDIQSLYDGLAKRES